MDPDESIVDGTVWVPVTDLDGLSDLFPLLDEEDLRNFRGDYTC